MEKSITTTIHHKKSYLVLICAAAILQGCASMPNNLEQSVMDYDKSSAIFLNHLLLMNIARADQHLPTHFTTISNIAASTNKSINIGFTPAFTGDLASRLLPLGNASYSESPTVSITPIEGDAFTQRMLMPIPESKVSSLLRQNTDIDQALRLLASDFRVIDHNKLTTYYNQPSDKQGYTFFRQYVLHLSSIQDAHALYAEPVRINQTRTLNLQNTPYDFIQGIKNQSSIKTNAARNTVSYIQTVNSKIIITNYNTHNLSVQEKQKLYDLTNDAADDEITVDIKPQYTGGNWPITGYFRLRSFQHVISFLGRSIHDDPEYDVKPNEKTAKTLENPASTIEIETTSHLDQPHVLALNNIGYRLGQNNLIWNKNGVQLLQQVFQMTMSSQDQTPMDISILK